MEKLPEPHDGSLREDPPHGVLLRRDAGPGGRGPGHDPRHQGSQDHPGRLLSLLRDGVQRAPLPAPGSGDAARGQAGGHSTCTSLCLPRRGPGELVSSFSG